MPPHRRETETEKKRRDDQAQAKHEERMSHGKPITDIEAKLLRTKISSSGKLMRG